MARSSRLAASAFLLPLALSVASPQSPASSVPWPVGGSLAAEALNVSQPTVSVNIRKLEDAHGVALFQRSSRGVVLTDYLADATVDFPCIPEEPFVGSFSGTNEGVDWAVQWLPEAGEVVAESYVNLIPTPLGGDP